MTSPYESPKGETPIQRRERLMNLTNPTWTPPPPPEEEEETPPKELKATPKASPEESELTSAEPDRPEKE